MKRFLVSVTVSVLIATLATVLVWQRAYQAELKAIDASARQILSQVMKQLNGQLSSARILPTLIARNKSVVDAMETAFLDNQPIADYLIQIQELAGVDNIRILNKNGDQIFSTSNDEIGTHRSDSSYFQTAMQGALGVAITYEFDGNIRSFSFARSILGSTANQIGAVAVDINLEPLESEFRPRLDTMLLVDQFGIVVFSNRPNMLFRRISGFLNHEKNVPLQGPYPDDVIRNWAVNKTMDDHVELWQWEGPANRNLSYLAVQEGLLPLNLTAVMLTNRNSAATQATKIALLFVATIVVITTLSFAIQQRRRRLVDCLQAEQQLTVELDRRILMRSKELETAQAELLKSQKLSALGKMSAAIGHELNQPIASIQNFAVNAKRFLEKKETPNAIKNLDDIEQQTERMSRIIKNLRSFVKSDHQAAGPVEINSVILQALELSKQRLETENVVLSLIDFEEDVIAHGGRIRLQQVMLNLIGNALEAMSEQTEKRLTLSLQIIDKSVQLFFHDNGPGISEPTRVFDPFYTTKSQATEEGLGLGLSISYGFVESFGGNLTAVNHVDGGALFILTLPLHFSG